MPPYGATPQALTAILVTGFTGNRYVVRCGHLEQPSKLKHYSCQTVPTVALLL